jgi:putative oxidoreductase
VNRDLALLLLRLTGVGLAVGHGWAKVVALSSGGGERFIAGVAELGFPAPGLFAWAAALAEFAGGLCVALGLGTRVAAGFAAFTMFVAAFGRHKAHAHFAASLGLLEASADTLKAWGSPEMALVYLAGFTSIALLGPGRLALDAMFSRKK